jgi:hypothetical protein
MRVNQASFHLSGTSYESAEIMRRNIASSPVNDSFHDEVDLSSIPGLDIARDATSGRSTLQWLNDKA